MHWFQFTHNYSNMWICLKPDDLHIFLLHTAHTVFSICHIKSFRKLFCNIFPKETIFTMKNKTIFTQQGTHTHTTISCNIHGYNLLYCLIPSLRIETLCNHNRTVHSPRKMLLFWHLCLLKSPSRLIWQPGASSIIFSPGCSVTERHHSASSLLWGDRCHLHHSQIARCCHVWWAGVAWGRSVGGCWVGNIFQRL